MEQEAVVVNLGPVEKRVKRGGQVLTEVADLVVELKVPGTLSYGYDVAGAVGSNPRRAMIAALGVCWEAGPTPGLPARLSQHGFRVLEYGGLVEDALLKRGVRFSALMKAATQAFNLLGESLPSEEEVKAAEGFSDGEADSDSPSSPSNEPGDSREA